MSNPSRFRGECICIDEPNVPPDLHRVPRASSLEGVLAAQTRATEMLTERVINLEARIGVLENVIVPIQRRALEDTTAAEARGE